MVTWLVVTTDTGHYIGKIIQVGGRGGGRSKSTRHHRSSFPCSPRPTVCYFRRRRGATTAKGDDDDDDDGRDEDECLGRGGMETPKATS